MGSKGVGICVIYAKRINRYVAVEGENVAEVLLLSPRILRRVWDGDNIDGKIVAIPAVLSSDFLPGPPRQYTVERNHER